MVWEYDDREENRSSNRGLWEWMLKEKEKDQNEIVEGDDACVDVEDRDK